MAYSHAANVVHLAPVAHAQKGLAIAIRVKIKARTFALAERTAGELSSRMMSFLAADSTFAHSACGPAGTGCSCKKGTCNCDQCENKIAGSQK
jgi:hypothetical protein